MDGVGALRFVKVRVAVEVVQPEGEVEVILVVMVKGRGMNNANPTRIVAVERCVVVVNALRFNAVTGAE